MSKKGFTTKLSSIAFVLQGQSPESKYYSDFDGVPFLQGNRTFGGMYPSFDTYTKKVTKLAKKGDVLMSVRAPVGALNFAPCDLCIGRGLASLRAKNGNNNFVYYALKYNVGNLIKQGSATTFDSVNKDIINDFELIIPESETERDKIASVLSTLDAKIELNNKINTELEAMAKTLYDYWFVQFDFPNENGKPYKSSGGEMVWSEELKREVPKGWEVEMINKKVKIGSGFPFDSDDYCDNGEYKIITIKNVQDGSLDTSTIDKIDFIPEKINDFCILKVGDVLMSLTGNVGRMCFVDQENLLLNQRVGKLIGEKDFVIYTYLFFQRPENQARLDKIAGGSSQSNLSPIDAVKDFFAIPPKNILDNFSKVITPIFDQMVKNKQENQKLAELRDFLLPMLMNGQVVVE